jgi:hypothetical protein
MNVNLGIDVDEKKQLFHPHLPACIRLTIVLRAMQCSHLFKVNPGITTPLHVAWCLSPAAATTTKTSSSSSSSTA